MTSFKKCVICQADRSNEILRKAKESSVSTFTSALTLRQDEVYDRLSEEIDHLSSSNVLWHSSCYSTYTSQQNILYATASSSQHDEKASKDDRRITWSALTPPDWSKCFICHNKTHKKSRDMHSVCTLETCKTITRAR